MAEPIEHLPVREWRVRGYDGIKVIFSLDVPEDTLSRERVVELLRLLAARHLTDREIVSAVLEANGLLELQADVAPSQRITMIAGDNPHYVAGLFQVDENGVSAVARERRMMRDDRLTKLVLAKLTEIQANLADGDSILVQPAYEGVEYPLPVPGYTPEAVDDELRSLLQRGLIRSNVGLGAQIGTYFSGVSDAGQRFLRAGA